MLVLEKARLTAFVLIALTTACGGTVVFEEDGGAGLSGQGGDGDGGAPTTSGDGGSSASNSPTTTNVSSGPNTNTSVGPTGVTVGPTSSGIVSSSVGPGPGPGPTSTSTGNPGCGTLIDDIGGLGGPACESCAESSCCFELQQCSVGTPCYDCIFSGDCSGQGEDALNALSNCINGPCGQACNGGGCEEFECFETGECISWDFVCDGRFNCGDGTDESPEVCGGCGGDDFQCFDGQCIPGNWVCDGVEDCIEGEDEACGGCGPNDFTCRDGSCIPGAWQCDEIVDCVDGADENPGFCGGCGQGSFTCNDGSCIPADWTCDGFPDCNQGEDEFCSNSGICDSGLSTGDPDFDECFGEQCCFEFEICTDFGSDVDACWSCINNGGGPLCDDAIFCAQNADCDGGPPPVDICGTGITTGDPNFDQCLTDSCCDGLFFCLDQGQDACLECLNDPDHGPDCDLFSDCSCDTCGFCF